MTRQKNAVKGFIIFVIFCYFVYTKTKTDLKCQHCMGNIDFKAIRYEAESIYEDKMMELLKIKKLED